ncbi:hypothetical protein FGG08_006422 [Glutinoglossum americanum]|uniref:Peptidase family M20/M25/M40 protein n=1 Tax=Glutinoglossum americanum TaxID=1670608 RepID=A0A9P8KUZ1_9PEZI|nr:hypothetical protein FGG08_006422 [Glutinoglossum americanum]
MPGFDSHAGNSLGKTRPSLRAPFTSSRRSRPPDPAHIMYEYDETLGGRRPLKMTADAKQQQPKGGIMARFARSTTKKMKDASTDSKESGPLPARHHSYPVPGTPSRDSASLAARSTMTIDTSGGPVTPTISTTPLSATPTLVSKSSGMNLGAKLQKTKPKPPRHATNSDLEAPPLFQAYPQAIKHASLSASTLSPETILKRHSQSLKSGLGQDILQNMVELGSLNNKKEEKARKKHRRKGSSPMANAEWTNKVYVLLTSGCLLQYAGDGSFDRLPERVMQLGKDSVAFASDVIPGKHWVLQISQDVDREGEPPAEPPKSLFSKLSFRSSESRKPTSNFLLVLDNPEDLHSWMFAVRQEIELLGGTRHKPEAGMTGSKTSPGEHQLRERPSRRYLITRDPNQISQFRIQRDVSPGFPEEAENRRGRTGSDQTSARRRSSIRPSMEAPSVSTTAASYDQSQLDRLRESRLSYLSTGTRTLTSRDTSPDELSSKERASSAKRHSRNTHPSAINTKFSPPPTDRRRSTNTSPSVRSPSGEPNSMPKLPLWQSTYERGFKAPSPSPSTPNFSVPNYNTPIRYSLVPRVADVPPVPIAKQTEDSETLSSQPKLVKKRSSSSSMRPVSTVGSLQSATDWTSRKTPNRNTIAHSAITTREFSQSASRAPFDVQIHRQSVPGASRPSTSSDTSPDRYHSLHPLLLLGSSAPTSPVTPSPSFTNPQRPATANPKKSRRPASLQVQPHDHATYSHNIETAPSSGTSTASHENLPPRSSSRAIIHNRKSMPLLSLPPPPMPPPNCPLPAPPPLPSGESVYLNVQGVAKEGGGLVIAPGGEGGEVRKLGARHSFCAMRAGIVREGAWV